MILGLGFAMWLGAGCIKGHFSIAKNTLDRVLLIFLILYVISITWSPQVDFGLVRLGKLARNAMLYVMVVDYLSVDFWKGYRNIAMCLLMTGFAQVLVFFVSIAQHGGLVAMTMLLQAESVQSNNPLLSVVRSDPGLGIFMRGIASWMPLCVFAGWSVLPSIRNRVLSIGCSILIWVLGLMTVISGTRSAIIGLVAALLTVYLLKVRDLTQKGLVLGMVSVVVFVLGAWQFNIQGFVLGRFSVETIETDPAIYERLEFYERALNSFMESPVLGTGVSGITMGGENGRASVHNVYLQVLGELGVIGGVVFLLLLVVWIWSLLSARSLASKAKDNVGKHVATILLGATVFFFTYFLVGHDLEGQEPWIVMLLVSALSAYQRERLRALS
jgi:O-antigen ligase